jgi:hypothetical protein
VRRLQVVIVNPTRDPGQVVRPAVCGAEKTQNGRARRFHRGQFADHEILRRAGAGGKAGCSISPTPQVQRLRRMRRRLRRSSGAAMIPKTDANLAQYRAATDFSANSPTRRATSSGQGAIGHDAASPRTCTAAARPHAWVAARPPRSA